MEPIVIERYIWQRCLGYSDDFRRKYWQCKAILDDGTTRIFYEATTDGVHYPAYMPFRPHVEHPLPQEGRDVAPEGLE